MAAVGSDYLLGNYKISLLCLPSDLTQLWSSVCKFQLALQYLVQVSGLQVIIFNIIKTDLNSLFFTKKRLFIVYSAKNNFGAKFPPLINNVFDMSRILRSSGHDHQPLEKIGQTSRPSLITKTRIVKTLKRICDVR